MAGVTAAFSAERPAEDIARDADRKPDQMVLFADLKPGQRVADFMPGGGYFTKVFSNAVGPAGKVYAITPEPIAKMAITKGKTLSVDPDPKWPNVVKSIQPTEEFTTAEPLDLFWISQNYHDLHDNFMGPANVAKFNKAVFAALKPGGLYIVLDHAAQDGSGLRDTETLHRIDPEAVKKEVVAAGFVFVGESPVLRNSADDRTKKVFDPSLRGHTDQFIYKFRRPE